MKKDGSIRICGDYKVTVNRASKLNVFLFHRIEDLFASLAGGKKFSKLDLAHAYQQVLLDEQSKKLVVINTPKGLFSYNRLPFGISQPQQSSSRSSRVSSRVYRMFVFTWMIFSSQGKMMQNTCTLWSWYYPAWKQPDCVS